MTPEPRLGQFPYLNSRIDHTLLKPDLSESIIVQHCQQAIEYTFHSVCVFPCWVKLARSILNDSKVRVCSVVGFPSGSSLTGVKRLEAELAVRDGASELDMVANLGWIVQEDWVRFSDQVTEVRRALPADIVFKVIIESSTLSSALRRQAVRTLIECGADFVKTGTGLRESVNSQEVADLKAAAGSAIKIKASGGIKTASLCYELLAAGADRIGTSSSVTIMQSQASSA